MPFAYRESHRSSHSSGFHPNAARMAYRPAMLGIPALVMAVALGNLLVPLNSTMIVVALPLIARDLAIDRTASAWLVTSYLIAMASLQPVAGRLGDRVGRRRLMLGALVYFGLASVGAALSTDIVVLVLFRLQQALAAAAIVPNGLAILRGSSGETRAGAYFGISGATTGVGAAAGPLLGGLLASIDWRWIFLVNVPLAGLALALAWRSLPMGSPPRPTSRPDLAGAVGLGVLLSVAAWTLTGASRSPDAFTVALIAVLAVGGALFVRYEARHADAALPPRLFAVRAFSGANLTIALANLALYGTLIAVPVILAGSGPEASLRSGIALSALSVAMIVLSPVSGVLVDRAGARWPTALGGMLIATGLALPVFAGRTSDFLVLVAALPIAGAGVALTFPATRLAAVDSVPARHAALASGVTSSSCYFGGMIGALAAAAALDRPSGPAVPQLFMALAAAGLAAAAAGLLLPARARDAGSPGPLPRTGSPTD